MSMKVRRFNIEQNGAVMTKDGEFLHINDVMLLLKEERESAIGCIKIKEEAKTDFSQKQLFAYQHQVNFIDKLINKIRKQD